jgi:hypothetical protein
MKLNIFIVVLLAAAVGTGCSKGKSADDSKVIAAVGSQTLTERGLAANLYSVKGQDSSTAAELFIEDWATQAALYEMAKRESFDTTASVQALVKRSEMNVVAAKFVEKKLNEPAVTVTPADAEAYYAEHKSEFFFEADAYQVARIYARTAGQLSSLRNRILQSKDVDKVVAAIIDFKTDASLMAKNAEELQLAKRYRTQVQLGLESETMKNLLSRMTRGDASPVLKLSDTVFVCLKLFDRRAKLDAKPLVAALPEAEARLRMSKEKQTYENFLQAIKKEITLNIK